METQPSPHGKVDMKVQGKCRGCDAATVNVSSRNLAGRPADVRRSRCDHRYLLVGGHRPSFTTIGHDDIRSHDKSTSCHSQQCGPREAEVTLLYRSYVKSLNLSSTESVAKCNYGQVFQTTFIASFTINETVVEQDSLDVMGQAMLQTLKGLFVTSGSHCSPQFRNCQRVKTQFADGFNPGPSAMP